MAASMRVELLSAAATVLCARGLAASVLVEATPLPAPVPVGKV